MQVAKPFLLTLEIIFCLANGIYKLSLTALTSLLIPPVLFHFVISSVVCFFSVFFAYFVFPRTLLKNRIITEVLTKIRILTDLA